MRIKPKVDDDRLKNIRIYVSLSRWGLQTFETPKTVMIEIPESKTLAVQISNLLVSRKISGVFTATHPHRFTWYTGDPLGYPELLTDRTICSAEGHGAFVDIHLDDDLHLSLSDGVNIRLYAAGADIPAKYQLLISFDDESFLVLTVAMYGGINLYRGVLDNPYHSGAVGKISPLDDRFDTAYFEFLVGGCKKNCTAKAFLATEQRIPGLGNGVLQDILLRSGVHPKRKIADLSREQFHILYNTLKSTLSEMTALGGRDTEKDLLGNPGGYKTLLSRNSCDEPCPGCGGSIVKEAYLGGAIYYCPVCQPLDRKV